MAPMIPDPAQSAIVGVILAGGRSRRMGGGDKCLLPLAGRPLLDHVVTRLRPQVGTIAINANGDPARFAGFGLPVVPDPVDQRHRGPLAGILAGMRWASVNRPGAGVIATVPSDTPFLPTDLIARLAASAEPAQIVVARSEGRLHPVFGVFPIIYADDLDRFMRESAVLRVDAWLARHDVRVVDFPAAAEDAPSPFLNINTREHLERAEAILGTADSGRRHS